MLSLINYRLRVTLNDGRQLTGQMLAFDPHMNLVLADTEEFRKLKRRKGGAASAAKSKAGNDGGEDDEEEDDDESSTAPMPSAEQKRALGLIILRGETIVSLSVEGPPPADKGVGVGGPVSTSSQGQDRKQQRLNPLVLSLIFLAATTGCRKRIASRKRSRTRSSTRHGSRTTRNGSKTDAVCKATTDGCTAGYARWTSARFPIRSTAGIPLGSSARFPSWRAASWLPTASSARLRHATALNLCALTSTRRGQMFTLTFFG